VDFKLYARVLWRFRLLVAAGLLLAISLAFLSIVKVTPDGLAYRQRQLWSADLRLLVTQRGFPEGRLYAQSPTQPGELTTPNGDASPVADPARFNTLAILYAELATSDPVRRLMSRGRPFLGRVIATPLRDDQSGVLLPLIDIVAISDSPGAAARLARQNAAALSTFISEQQRLNDVPAADRVVVQTIVDPRRVALFQPRSKTMAMVVFLAVMFATIGLAFILENTRPRRPALAAPTESELRGAEHRRSA
jgi:hypothetical protein